MTEPGWTVDQLPPLPLLLLPALDGLPDDFGAVDDDDEDDTEDAGPVDAVVLAEDGEAGFVAVADGAVAVDDDDCETEEPCCGVVAVAIGVDGAFAVDCEAVVGEDVGIGAAGVSAGL